MGVALILQGWPKLDLQGTCAKVPPKFLFAAVAPLLGYKPFFVHWHQSVKHGPHVAAKTGCFSRRDCRGDGDDHVGDNVIDTIVCLIPFEEVDLQRRKTNNNNMYITTVALFHQKLLHHSNIKPQLLVACSLFASFAPCSATCNVSWVLNVATLFLIKGRKKTWPKERVCQQKLAWKIAIILSRIAPETTLPKRLLKHPIPWPPHLWLAGPWWAGRLAFRLSGDTNPSSALCFWVDFWQGI